MRQTAVQHPTMKRLAGLAILSQHIRNVTYGVYTNKKNVAKTFQTCSIVSIMF